MTKEGDIIQQPTQSIDDIIDSIPVSTSNSILDIENIVNQLLTSLPKINRNAWRIEMEDMIVPVQKNPTTFDINEGLALSQGYRDRLSEMLIYAQREYKLRKRCLDMLFDAVNVVSKASSADKRKGEAAMKYPLMIIQTETADIFCKEIEGIYNNIKSAFESISRQASVMNMQVTLGERRQGNPKAIDVIPQSNAEEITGNKELNWDSF